MEDSTDPQRRDMRALRDAIAAVTPAGERTDWDESDLRERAARLAWSCTVEPGDAVAGRLLQALGAAAAYDAVRSGELLKRAERRQSIAGSADADRTTLGQLREASERWVPRLDLSRTLDVLRASAKLGVTVILPGDDAWPPRLDDLGPHAPVAIWIRGSASVLGTLEVSVALVGARASTAYGEEATLRLASGLGGRGFAIVSGGAYGIDAVAHRSALAEEAPTVAVMAGGADRLYPSGNRMLLERIVAHGALLSELPVGQAPTRWRFLQRNRIIAALSSATVVVEAGRRSGAANTAAHVLTLGRPLGAVPGPITSAASVGCHRLIRESDATLITTVDDVIELAAGLASGDATLAGAEAWATAAGATPRQTANAVRARDALHGRRARSLGEVSSLSGLSIAETRAGLLELELVGAARETPLGWLRQQSA